MGPRRLNHNVLRIDVDKLLRACEVSCVLERPLAVSVSTSTEIRDWRQVSSQVIRIDLLAKFD